MPLEDQIAWAIKVAKDLKAAITDTAPKRGDEVQQAALDTTDAALETLAGLKERQAEYNRLNAASATPPVVRFEVGDSREFAARENEPIVAPGWPDWPLLTREQVSAFAAVVNPRDPIAWGQLASEAKAAAGPFAGAVTGHLRGRPIMEGAYTACAKGNHLVRVSDCEWPQAFAPYWGWCRPCAEKDRTPMKKGGEFSEAMIYSALRRRGGNGSYGYGGGWASIEEIREAVIERNDGTPRRTRPPLRVKPAPEVAPEKPKKTRDEDDFMPKDRRKRDITLE